MLSRIYAKATFAFYQGRGGILRRSRNQHNGTRFTMSTRTGEETHRAVTFSNKEPETLAWIDSFVGDRPVFYDVGALVGVYSLYCKARHPESQIYSFEPEAQSFASLCRNIAMNRFRQIQPFQIAVAGKTGLGTLYVASLSSGAGASALESEYQFLDARGGGFEQGIFHLSLDAMVNQFGLARPNYLKIDVDGLEEQILAGAADLLSAPELRGLLVEFQYRDEAEIEQPIARLKALGLELAERSDWVSSAAGLNSRNFIFARSA